MKPTKTKILRTQVLAAMIVLFGLNSTAKANLESEDYKPYYKVESCDCIGYSDGIPTFLSDLTGEESNVYGEGKTINAAKESAQNMCVETYRNFASLSVKKEKKQSISYNGCRTFKSQPNGEWAAL